VTDIAKKVLPADALDRYRRRRALRRFLRSLSFEIYDRQQKLRVEELEGTVLARRPDITERLMKDLLDRTDVVLQELHRQIQGLQARQGSEIDALRADVEHLRATVAELQSRLGAREPAAD
jgi:polyhydroxyalkanoate synthesis regulator phasin